MAFKALSLLLVISLCAVALGKLDFGSRFGSSRRSPYRPTVPLPRSSQDHETQSQYVSDYFNHHKEGFDPYQDSYVEEVDVNDRYQNPDSNNPYQQSLYPSQSDYQYKQPVYENPEYEQSDDENAESNSVSPEPTAEHHPLFPGKKEPECSVGEQYLHSIPFGGMKNPNLKINPILASSALKCLEECCDLGPSVCQFIWVFESKCFAVACSSGHDFLCEPKEIFDENASKTRYFAITHPANHYKETGLTGDFTEGPTSGEAPTVSLDNDPTGTSTVETASLAGDDDDESQTEVEPSTQGVPTRTPPTPDVGRTDSDLLTTTPKESTLTPPTLAMPPDHPLENLTIAIDGVTEVHLPTNEVRLFASSWPNPPGVRFHWTRVSGRKEGVLNGMNDASVVLSELVPGVYGLKVTAESPAGQFGQSFVNVTVLQKPRDNTPPRPVISPSTNYTVELPQNTVIFDASQSQDDLGPENLHFLWQPVSGPMGTTGESDQALLTLNDPLPGKYEYKLTVTDSDGEQTVAFVHLKVEPERDYPPTANAGSDVVLKLPNSEVVLNGNRSTDDKPGLSFFWEILSEPRGLDVEGTDRMYCRVSKLTVGVYHFKLTVTDSAGQTDDSEVTVDVLAEKNEPPKAEAGGPYHVRYPTTSAVLDGSKSDDDYKKGMKYSWVQTSGPTDIQLSNVNTTHLSISGLHIDPEQGSPTTFTFNLTVEDYAGLSSTVTAELHYHKDPQILPHVSAGPDITITLPQNTAVLNGSETWDDFGITSYQWTRSDSSPAAGIPLLDSDRKPTLILSNLVNGTYNFTLYVTSKQGVKANDTMTLHVLANPYDEYIIQLHLDTMISNFSRSDLQDLGKYLSLTLDDYTIKFQGVYEHPPHTVVEFYAINSATHEIMNASDAWKKLTENGQDYTILHYHVVMVEMKECHLSCSGHGSCDQRTKRCRCDIFWMENPFTANTGRKESNCEWSIFYVVLIVLGVLVFNGIIIWLTCWCCLRRRSVSRTKRRIRYAIHDHGDGENKRMLSKEGLGYQHSSLMQSESETEEEVLFDSKRRSSSPVIKNNKLNSEKYGKNSSLVNTVIPK